MTSKSKRQEAELREASCQDTGCLSAEKDEISRAGRPQVAYTPQDNATPEGELSALAAIYRSIIESHELKKGLISESGGHDTRSSSSLERSPMAGHDE